ncbi:MAG: hydantoinase B/oxoprolinase family protein [Myxococcota bacterium]|nr:hydantoinase B/oxoprolinase family protein [Myxococcota bacterium]
MDDSRELWIDQGGTFTDLIYRHGSRLRVEKVLSSQLKLSQSVPMRRGTTVATNALLERSAPRVLLITNAGFGDLLEIGEQRREYLFDPFARRSAPLSAAVLELKTRLDVEGNVVENEILDPKRLDRFWAQGIRSVAVVFVHSPINPDIERGVARICERYGFTQISCGHRVSPSRGFLDRLRSTVADAALTPLLPREPARYMRSDGGLADHDSPQWSGINAVLSGPAGGAIAVARLVESLGERAAFGLDMGGTSADVCHIDGALRTGSDIEIGGWRLKAPVVEMETVASGGGSVLQMLDGMASVGPQSAGSDPGPACYGRGGPASLSDCEAILGRLPTFPKVCGPNRNESLYMDAAREALSALLPDESVEELAMEYKNLAAEQMANAILNHAARRGVDPSKHVLVAFGGAGPAHACSVAERAGMRRIIIPRLAGVFSAFGIGTAPRKAEWIEPVKGFDVAAARRKIRLKVDVPWSGAERWLLRLCYANTNGVLEIEIHDETSVSKLTDRFIQQHKQEFGFAREGHAVQAIELVLRLEESRVVQTFGIEKIGMTPIRVRAFFDGGFGEVPLVSFEQSDGITGPAMVELEGSIAVVESGWRGTKKDGALVLERTRIYKSSLLERYHPIHTAIFGNRVMAVAEQMGERLARLARSISIRERRDFSCAVFDADGRLIANAPHVPVHLGAMGEMLRSLVQRYAFGEGEVWISNDPYQGGSHLPDITAYMPLYHQGEVWGYVGCRGHHIDIGGLQPGSMPPFSSHIEDEGIFIKAFCLLRKGQIQTMDISQSRQQDDLKADLEAQVAACVYGIDHLSALLHQVGSSVFRNQLHHLYEHAGRVSRAWRRKWRGTYSNVQTRAEDVALDVSLQIDEEEAKLSISAPPHDGNRNAPASIVRACLLYVIRSSVPEEIPLNEGLLDGWCIELNEGGLFDPHYPQAVVGGNVETSQQLVDSMQMALGLQGSSQGTMNNLCIACGGSILYETLGGGAGAGDGVEGGSAVQIHMTNTKATDVEELEHRLPVRLIRWSRRQGSGGRGRYLGGDGLIKEWLFLQEANVSLLASRRRVAPEGILGGESGLPGEDLCYREGAWQPMPALWRAKAGEKCRISTPGGGGFLTPPLNEDD